MRNTFLTLRSTALAMMLLSCAGFALANCGHCGGATGHDHSGHSHAEHGKDLAAQMEMMKAEFAKCAICKHMLPYMDMMPIMSMEVVDLNDGMAIMHNVNDPSKVARVHEMSAKMYAAGEAYSSMSPAEAKEQLCQFCNSFHELVQAGANMSHGDTENGDIMIFTSSDPAVQAKIGELMKVCEMQAEMASH